MPPSGPPPSGPPPSGPPTGPPPYVGPSAGPPPAVGPPAGPGFGGPPPGFGPPGGPGFGPPPPRKGGGSAAIVVLVAVLAVVVLLGGGGYAAYRLTSGDSSTDDSTTTATPTGPGCDDLDNSGNGQVLANQMTTAIQKHHPKDWLALASTDEAKAAMKRWWSNVSAIGFSTGGATVDTDAPNRGKKLTIELGFHNKLDETLDGKPAVPQSTYDLGVSKVADDGGCHLVVTSFSSVQHMPWDDTDLHVAKGRYTEVIAPASAASQAERLLPSIDAAVSWSRAFYRGAGQADDLAQPGMLVFLPATAQQQKSWFRKKPNDIGTFGGTFTQPGLDLSSSSIGGTASNGKSLEPVKPVADQTGGVRVVVGSGGQRLPSQQLSSLAVGQYVDAIYATSDNSATLGGSGVPDAVSVGAARLAQAYFYVAPDDGGLAARTGTSQALSDLRYDLRSRIGSFDGRWPTDGQLAGPDYTYYSALAATTFGYQAATTDLHFALQCIGDSYTQGGGPFGGVVTNISHGTLTFANPRQEQGRWAAYIRATT